MSNGLVITCLHNTGNPQQNNEAIISLPLFSQIFQYLPSYIFIPTFSVLTDCPDPTEITKAL